MLARIPDLPGRVLGFTASGRVTEADYESVLVPAVEAALREHERVRLLYHLGEEFESFSAGAVWDDAKIGLKHLAAWERVALVTDVDWLKAAAKAFGFFMPAAVRVFSNAEFEAARTWVCEDRD